MDEKCLDKCLDLPNLIAHMKSRQNLIFLSRINSFNSSPRNTHHLSHNYILPTIPSL
jgi:hypothetical protein